MLIEARVATLGLVIDLIHDCKACFTQAVALIVILLVVVLLVVVLHIVILLVELLFLDKLHFCAWKGVDEPKRSKNKERCTS